MPVNTANLRRQLKAFAWKPLFIEVLRWSNPTEKPYPVLIGSERVTITPVAQMGGMHVYICTTANGAIPDSATRKAIEHQVKERQYEHIIIFEDGARQQAIFQWMKRGQGAARSREFPYTLGQSGEQLLQRLSGIAFEFADLDEEGKIDIARVVEKVAKSLDVETVTKKFYDEFTRQRDAFQKFLQGIPATADDDARWYVSVMLNRLMFIYFVQTKGFLANDRDYLKHKLDWSKKNLGAGRYFRDCLQVLFFEGFAKEERERTPTVQKLLGTIPYLNGGLFIKHPLEEKYGDALNIADEAFDKLFTFFGNWRWHLSERPGDHQNEIDPDVLGYIFEKYINQKQMGAYYTKDDITGYICRNTIIPRLFDKADLSLVALKLPQTIHAYLYEAVTQRDHLPTETEREYNARQERVARLVAESEDGKLATINDAITANLNVEAMIYDLVPTLDAHAIKRLYDALATLSVLDPTCGSGAFLFAAIKILKPIYEQVLERMAILIERRQTAGLPFKDILDAEQAHANRDYFVTKSIVVRNLYGVDIMEEATEICKLRLFLRLVADLDDADHIEPLPDIDFNIRVGNALVGYATVEDVGGGYRGGLTAVPPRVQKLVGEIEAVQRELSMYRDSQLQLNPSSSVFRSARTAIRTKIAALNTALDGDMLKMGQIHRESDGGYNTQPFHWFTAFYEILANGGFDVIVGNPPYVEYSKIKGDCKKDGEERYKLYGYETDSCGNLYAFVVERSVAMIRQSGRIGLIVPISITSAQRMVPLQEILVTKSAAVHLSNFALRPAALFPGVMQRLTVFLFEKGCKDQLLTTDYITWYSEERHTLFDRLNYTNLEMLRQDYSLPKIGSIVSASVLKQILKQGKYWKDYRDLKGKHVIYYHNAGGYWIKTFNFKPYYKSLTDPDKKHTTISELRLPTSDFATIYLCVLNSSTFYYFWKTLTDARHLYPSDIAMFPISIPLNSDSLKKLEILGQELMSQYRQNARRVIYGNAEVDQYSVSSAKPIIDEIDRVLAAHYGFTDAELDFIINYDIKYRMGRDAAEPED